MKKGMNKKVTVNDTMQSGYTYTLTESPGKNFHLDFTPDLSPKEMLALGVFGGKYMTDAKSEFPKNWFTHAKLSSKETDCTLNYFTVCAGQPLSVWQKKGWIHADDPRGWFQSHRIHP